MTTTQPRESGVSALLLAGSLLVIMGMAAIAIDLGAAFNERRQDQSAADAAALAAGVEFLIGNGESDAVAAAKAIVDENLGRTLQAGDWSSCTDPDAYPPTPETVANGLDSAQPCISFGDVSGTQAYDRIRVKIPDQATGTTFGRVLGVIEINTSAVAEAELAPVLEQGAFPASVFNGTSAGATICIKTGTGNASNTSCGDPSTGNFGNFQPYFYKEVNPASNPASKCTSGDQVNPLAYVMANGLDHSLGVASGIGAGTRLNGDDCPQAGGPLQPDSVRAGGGYSNNDVTMGLIAGGSFDSTNFDGRLTRPTPWSSSGTYGTANVFGETLDNRPLWTFLDPGQAAAADNAITAATGSSFDACEEAAGGPNSTTNPAESGTDFTDALDSLILCLNEYSDNGINLDDGIFTDDLFESHRLTVVPEYWQFVPNGNHATPYDIKDFRPVYINSVWSSNSNQWTCSSGIVNVAGDFCRHDPGRSGTMDRSGGPGQKRVDSASAIVLNCEMLPGLENPAERCKKIQTPSGNTITVFLNLYLVK